MGIGSVGGSDFDPLSVIKQIQDQKIDGLQSQLTKLPSDEIKSAPQTASQNLGGLQKDSFSSSAGASSASGSSSSSPMGQTGNESSTPATKSGLAAEDNSGSSDTGSSMDVMA